MATYYWRGLTNPNWNNAGSWSTGSTSTLGGLVPTSSDDAIFDVNSSACTVNITTAQVRSINFTAYTNTITMNNSIAIGVGNGSNMGVFLGVNMGISGTGALNIATGNCTIQSNGRSWPNTLSLGTTGLNSLTFLNIADTWTQLGVLNITGGAARYNVSGAGRIDFYGPRIQLLGRFPTISQTNPRIVILSACTISGTQAADSAYTGIPFDFSAGTNTVTIGNAFIGGGLWKYYSGNVVFAPGTTINVTSGEFMYFDMSPIVFNNLTMPFSPPAGGATRQYIIYSDLNVGGNLTCNAGSRNFIFSGVNTSINITGSTNLTGSAGGAASSPGVTLRFKGNGTLSVVDTLELGVDMSIECGVNTLSIVGDITYKQNTGQPKPTFTYTSGILDLTSHSTIYATNVNFNLQGTTMKTISFILGGTNTFLSRLSATTISMVVPLSGLIFNGSGGFTTGSLSYTMTNNTTVTFQESVEYVTNNSLFLRGTAATNTRLVSSSASVRTIFTLKESATQDVAYTTTTRLDSSSGQTIYTRYGTLTDTLNWQLLRNPVTKATSFLL